MRLSQDELAFLEEMSALYHEQEYLQLIQHIEEEYAANPHFFSH